MQQGLTDLLNVGAGNPAAQPSGFDPAAFGGGTTPGWQGGATPYGSTTPYGAAAGQGW